ncbi:hypothetical protein HK097_002145, partial [Rhizophlyctis rosea]
GKGKGGKRGGAGKATEVLLNEAPAGVEKTEEILGLEGIIREKGELVKKLKGEKEDFAGALGELIAAKKKLTETVNAVLKK